MNKEIAGVRVLIVEDEPLVGIMLEGMLQELGVNVAAIATKLEDALLIVVNCEFDAAVLDVNLSGTQSYPVADRLREKGIPFVFATGYGSRILVGDYREDRFIHKPYSSLDLKRVLQDMVGRR